MRTSVLVAVALLVGAGAPSGFAAEPVTIEKLLASPQSYNLKMVTLQGTAHQIQILTSPPPAHPQIDTQCLMVHPPYTLVLSDETGFLQITVRARPPCVSRHSPAEPPDIADGDTVTIDAQVTVSRRAGAAPGSDAVEVLAVNIRREGN